MRIRRCASRILGLTHTSVLPEPSPLVKVLPLTTPSPPQPPPPAPAAREPHAGSGGFTYPTSSAENCELSRSPWDLINELGRLDPQEEKKLVESYFVHVIGRASWLFPTCLPAAISVDDKKPAVAVFNEVSVQPSYEAAKKLPVNNKLGMKSKPKHKEKVKKEDHANGGATGVAQGLTACKKSDGKSWLSGRPVSQPSSKKRRKAADAGEGFYYYTGFGPFRTKKRHCRSSNRMHESAAAEQDQEGAPAPQDGVHESARAEQAEDPGEDSTYEPAPPEQKQDLPEDTTLEQPAPPEQEQLALPEDDCAAPIGEQAQADDADRHQAAAQHDRSRREDIAGIAGIDEESSSDNAYCYSGKGKTRVIGVNGESQRKGPWKKRRRKPIKARSLKSLMYVSAHVLP